MKKIEINLSIEIEWEEISNKNLRKIQNLIIDHISDNRDDFFEEKKEKEEPKSRYTKEDQEVLDIINPIVAKCLWRNISEENEKDYIDMFKKMEKADWRKKAIEMFEISTWIIEAIRK